MTPKKPTKGVLTLKGVVPPEDSTRAPKEYPISRDVLLELDGYVEVTIPKGAQIVKSEHVGKRYLHFLRGVKGKSVWKYVYGRALVRHLGETVVAKVTVKRANFENKPPRIYCDYQIVPGATPTHELSVVKDATKIDPNAKPIFRLDVGGGALLGTTLA